MNWILVGPLFGDDHTMSPKTVSRIRVFESLDRAIEKVAQALHLRRVRITLYKLTEDHLYCGQEPIESNLAITDHSSIVSYLIQKLKPILQEHNNSIIEIEATGDVVLPRCFYLKVVAH